MRRQYHGIDGVGAAIKRHSMGKKLYLRFDSDGRMVGQMCKIDSVTIEDPQPGSLGEKLHAETGLPVRVLHIKTTVLGFVQLAPDEPGHLKISICPDVPAWATYSDHCLYMRVGPAKVWLYSGKRAEEYERQVMAYQAANGYPR